MSERATPMSLSAMAPAVACRTWRCGGRWRPREPLANRVGTVGGAGPACHKCVACGGGAGDSAALLTTTTAVGIMHRALPSRPVLLGGLGAMAIRPVRLEQNA